MRQIPLQLLDRLARATGGKFAVTPVMRNDKNESARKKPEELANDRQPAAEPEKPESGPGADAPVGKDDSLIGAQRLPRKGDEEMSP